MSLSRNSNAGHRGQLLASGAPLISKRPAEFIGGLFICLLVFGAASSFAQSLGEVARQERARIEAARKETGGAAPRPRFSMASSGCAKSRNR